MERNQADPPSTSWAKCFVVGELYSCIGLILILRRKTE